MKEDDIHRRAALIKLIVLDVDGVMTDGGVRIDLNRTESKSFFIRDGFGILIGRRLGLQFAIITGQRNDIILQRAERLGIEEVQEAFTDKLVALKEMLSRRSLSFNQTAYMGDDLFDLPVMKWVGLSAAPCDAHPECLKAAHWVSASAGGRGAVRELIELVIRARGQWEELLGQFVWK